MLSHIVVAIFISIAATLLWLTRRPWRTFPLAAAVGGVAVALPMVWLLPLLANEKYTQSMRYSKLIPKGTWTAWSWLPGPIRHTITDVYRAMLIYKNPSTGKGEMQPLWLPWWIWALGCVAIVAAGWYRRRSTLVLLILSAVLAMMFVEWPEHAIWNTRFLPFWLLTCGFLAAMGATELLRLAAMGVQSAYRWIRDGDLQDARARAWAEVATAGEDSITSTPTRSVRVPRRSARSRSRPSSPVRDSSR
jgi:hypothetical protein